MALRSGFARGCKLSYIWTFSDCWSSQVVVSHNTLITSNGGNNNDKEALSHCHHCIDTRRPPYSWLTKDSFEVLCASSTRLLVINSLPTVGIRPLLVSDLDFQCLGLLDRCSRFGVRILGGWLLCVIEQSSNQNVSSNPPPHKIHWTHEIIQCCCLIFRIVDFRVRIRNQVVDDCILCDGVTHRFGYGKIPIQCSTWEDHDSEWRIGVRVWPSGATKNQGFNVHGDWCDGLGVLVFGRSEFKIDFPDVKFGFDV